MTRKITGCRISGSPNLVPVVSLGTQKLTGVFPRTVQPVGHSERNVSTAS